MPKRPRAAARSAPILASLFVLVSSPVLAQSESDGGEARDVAAVLPMGRLVYMSDRGGDIDIWMLEAGSAEPVQVTSGIGIDRSPALSPDGTRVAYATDQFRDPRGMSARGSSLAAFDVYTVGIDGKDAIALATNRTFKSGPVWSPDGTMIAYDGEVVGGDEVRVQIHVVPADGSAEPVQLTADPVLADGPKWSPDGRRIAFGSLRHGQNPDDSWNREIYVMDHDGTDQVRLTADPADDGAAAWSPDGTMIAFDSDRAGNSDIYVMAADGADVVQLTDDPGDDAFPTWSPDGSMLAFVSDRDGDFEIYLMNADGSGQVRLTDNPAGPSHRGTDDFPDWGPTESEVASTTVASADEDGDSATGANLAGAIRAGACADAGEVVTPLADVSSRYLVDGVPSASLPVGAAPATPMLASVTTVPLTLADLVATDHSLLVSGADDAAVACGDIGGATILDGVLPVALEPLGSSGRVGTAVLRSTEEAGTRVEVYLHGAARAMVEPEPITPAPTSDVVAGPVSVDLAGDLYFGGWDLSVEEARFDPISQSIEVDTIMTNRSTAPRQMHELYRGTQAYVEDAEQRIHRLVFTDRAEVPPAESVRGTLGNQRPLPADFALDGAVLLIGDPGLHQASLPLTHGSIGESATPRELAVRGVITMPEVGRIEIEGARLEPATCRGRFDHLVLEPATDEVASVVLDVSASRESRGRVAVDSAVRLPDGSSVEGTPGRIVLEGGQDRHGSRLCYTIPTPATGDYVVSFESRDGAATFDISIPPEA